MITAPDATIIDTFTRITGYSCGEAVGQKPSMLKSGRHDRDFYVVMWSALTEQGHWREVIVEGVETVAQGHGIARPMLPSQLPAWVASWQPDAAWVGHQSLFFRNEQPRPIDLSDGRLPC